MTLQRTVQIICLTLFLGLLISAAFRFVGWLPHDLFLQLDPAAALLTGLSARIWLGGFAAALAVLAATVALGRFFCGYLCPLGTTIDGVDACIRKPGTDNGPISPNGPYWKYGVLVFAGAAALMGLSLAFLLAPIPLATRFFALVLLPLLQPALDLLLQLAAPLADRFDLTALLYLQLPLPRFDHQWLMLLLMLLILAGGRWQPRFWCRCLCPTNTLQPFGLATGLPGWLTPVITPQLGPCDPTCSICGQICPTQAIRALGPGERIWAKVGTAQVLRHKCLAWEFDRKCLVCDEVCPYDAIELKRVPELKVAVPFVDEKRCSGCGYCEHHCPVEAVPAIVVEPMEALRLESGSLHAKARAIGLDLQIRRSHPHSTAVDQIPYDAQSDALPPGFSE